MTTKPQPHRWTPSHVLCRSSFATSGTGQGEDRCDNLCFWENFNCKIFYTFWRSIWIKARYSGARKAVWAAVRSELERQGTHQTWFTRLTFLKWQKLYSNYLKQKRGICRVVARNSKGRSKYFRQQLDPWAQMDLFFCPSLGPTSNCLASFSAELSPQDSH